MRIEGKRAFITVAGLGIGRATAELFARERAEVIATDVEAVALESLTGCTGAHGRAL
jgi:2-keto-3-deoxy-L-fuconate dehydrogenase